MPSDYNDVMSTIGSTVADDAKNGVMAGWIDGTLYQGIQSELSTNYGLTLDHVSIADLMEEHGIDFGYNYEYSVADLIWDALQGE